MMPVLKRLLALGLLIFLAMSIYDHEKQNYHFEKTYHHQQSSFQYVIEHNKAYHAMSFQEKLRIRRILLKHIKSLQKAGWTNQTIQSAYLRYLPQDSLTLKDLDEQLENSQIIASQTFRRLFKTQLATLQTQEPLYQLEHAKQLLQLLLDSAHMPDELSDNTSETKSLLTHFDDSLSPSDSLWQDVAQLVQIAYPNDSLSKTNTLNRRLHQFRYVIACQQANWIRKHYKQQTDSDADALAKYLAQLDSSQYSLTEPARYHNKIASRINTKGQLKSIYPDNTKNSNFKVVITFHSEFILSSSGDFLLALDTKDHSTNGIINSATFNYASQNDTRHIQLDITPITYHEPDFVNHSLTQNNLTFREASIDEYKDKYNPIYSRHHKSAKQRSNAARKAFKRLLQNYLTLSQNDSHH
ncbi:DUF3114 domain-containing protein [Streptococcus sp. zg-JUN1979]|uniref:DUF3114 domain-containing protein n=1 Tax=Streptococcus sp. zg-JUN1979 TaxID=3391450 RepID=UPI0039A63A7E